MEVLAFVKKVNTDKKLNLNKLQVKTIAQSLNDIGVKGVFSSNAFSVEKQIVASARKTTGRKNPLKVIASQKQSSDLSCCPVCHRRMKEINVVGRKSLYCPDHRVTVPIPVSDSE